MNSRPQDAASAPPSDQTISVVLIEDHDMVAAAFATMLESEPDLSLLAITSTFEEGLQATRWHRPRVVITDLRLPDGDATTRIGELIEAGGGSKVLVVTGAPVESAVVDAFRAGATGFLSKTQPLDSFFDGIRSVARGDVAVAPEFVHVLVGGHDRNDENSLTSREREVLGLLADGKSTAGIAEALHVSPNTVRNHVTSILGKLDVHSRLEAVAVATKQGLLPPAGY